MQEKTPFADRLLYNEFYFGVNKCGFIALAFKGMFCDMYTTHTFYLQHVLSNWCFGEKIYNSMQICYSD